MSQVSPSLQRGPEWVTMAVLGKPRGVRGELFALPLTNHWDRFRAGRAFRVWFSADLKRESRELELEEAWSHNARLILKFVGVDSIDDAELLRGGDLCVHEADRDPLPDGEFYYDDLKGMQVIDLQTGKVLGVVSGFTEGIGPGVVDVRSQGEQCLSGEGSELWQIPFALDICREIDLEKRELRVVLPAGLRDLNGA